MKANDIDLSQLMANSNGYLWKTQQDLESVTKHLTNARELYRVALLNHDLIYSKNIEKLVKDKQPITTAKEIAKSKCEDQMIKLSETKEVKDKLAIYHETIRERLNTIKYIGKDTKPLR